MALRAWASLARLDKLKLIPQIVGVCRRGACFSLPAGRQPGQSLRATKDEARPAMFFNGAVPFARFSSAPL